MLIHDSAWFRVELGVSVVVWFAASACCTASSKQLLSKLAPFSCAMSVTALQFVCAALLGLSGLCFRSFSFPPRSVLMEMLAICFTYTIGFCLLNFSLTNLDASFAETVRSLEPLFTTVLTYAFGLRSGAPGFKTGACLATLLLGAAIVMWAQPALSPRGLFLGLLANVMFALRSLFVKAAQEKLQRLELPKLDGGTLFILQHVVGLVVLLPLAVLSGDRHCLHAMANRTEIWRFGAGSTLGFAVYNRLSLSVLMLLNAVSHSVCNALRRAVTVVSAAILLHTHVGLQSWFGITLIIGSSALYVLAAAAEQREAKEELVRVASEPGIDTLTHPSEVAAAMRIAELQSLNTDCSDQELFSREISSA